MDLENTSEGSTFPEHTEERRAGNWHFTGDNDDAITDFSRFKGKNPAVRFVSLGLG